VSRGNAAFRPTMLIQVKEDEEDDDDEGRSTI
jgi:hypothetical protein